MPHSLWPVGLVEVAVTPRFEIFYALQALESGAGSHLDTWRRDIERRIPARLRTRLAAIAPSALIWPVLADALRDEAPSISFSEMVDVLRKMDERSFQRAVLGGVFKLPGSVDGLMSGKVSLAGTVRSEASTQEKLLSLLGLHPFAKRSGSALAFERIVSTPGSYRDEVISVLESFWKAGFSDSWTVLEPRMRESARAMKQEIGRDGFEAFSVERNLPVTVDADTLANVRTGLRVALKSVVALNLIPSAFNTARLWAAYPDSHKRTRYFIPILDAQLLTEAAPDTDPSVVFKALGDTTRYAIASMLARAPMTSIELARAFEVSKPTISHHVQQLRAAGLLQEDSMERGVSLSLKRDVLEKASVTAAREMFSDAAASPAIRRSRRANKTIPAEQTTRNRSK